MVFVDELFKRSAKTGLTLLMFVGLPDVSVDKDKALGEEKSSVVSSNYHRFLILPKSTIFPMSKSTTEYRKTSDPL